MIGLPPSIEIVVLLARPVELSFTTVERGLNVVCTGLTVTPSGSTRGAPGPGEGEGPVELPGSSGTRTGGCGPGAAARRPSSLAESARLETRTSSISPGKSEEPAHPAAGG